MNSRLIRMLLRLYPRRIRNRYGDELLDLQSELGAEGEVSRTRLIRDMLAGALLVRPARQRAHLVIGAVLVIAGLAVAGTTLGGRGTDSPARASHVHARLAVHSVDQAGSATCFVAASSSCSLRPCTEFTGRSSDEGAVVYSSVPATRRRSRLTGSRCVAYPHVRRPRPVFVGE
jgi:hypothetical protein